MKKVLVSDYDKTFYLNEIDIKNNIKAINVWKKLGNIFIIATGRTYLDFKRKAKLYNIICDYVILDHGAVIIDKEENILDVTFINDKILNELMEYLKLNLCEKYFCSSILESRVDFDNKNITKINVKYENNDIALDIKKSIDSKFSLFVNCFLINDSTLEIVSKDINKSVAIKKIINKIGINKKDVYTIGDGQSDLCMINDFNGSCMKNSCNLLLNLKVKRYESVSNYVKEII